MVKDLEFDIEDDTCLVEYEEDKEYLYSEPDVLQDDAPLVDTLVKQLHEDWSLEAGKDADDGRCCVHCPSKVRDVAGFGKVHKGNLLSFGIGKEWQLIEETKVTLLVVTERKYQWLVEKECRLHLFAITQGKVLSLKVKRFDPKMSILSPLLHKNEQGQDRGAMSGFKIKVLVSLFQSFIQKSIKEWRFHVCCCLNRVPKN